MWAFLKKAFHFVSTVFLYSVFIVMIIVFLAIGAYFVDQAIGKKGNGEYRSPLFGAYVIISPSMVPNINVYDVVVTMRRDPNKIKVDDIITFISEDAKSAGVTITHRVVGIVDLENGRKAFRTKGDGNNVEDSTLVNDDHLIGKVLFKVPQLGQIQRLLTNFSGWLLLIVIPCVGIVLYDLVKLILLIMKKSDDESEDDSENPKISSERKGKEKLKKSEDLSNDSVPTQVQKLEENIPVDSSFALPSPTVQDERPNPIQVGDVLPLNSLEESRSDESQINVIPSPPLKIVETKATDGSHIDLEPSLASPMPEPSILNLQENLSTAIVSEIIPVSERKEPVTEEIELLDDELEVPLAPLVTIDQEFVPVEIESVPLQMTVSEEQPPLPPLPTKPIVIELPEELEQSSLLEPSKDEVIVPLDAYKEKEPVLPTAPLEPFAQPPIFVDFSKPIVPVSISLKDEVDLEKTPLSDEPSKDLMTTQNLESYVPLTAFEEREIQLLPSNLEPLPLPPEEESLVAIASTLSVSPPELPKAKLKPISSKKGKPAVQKKKSTKKSPKKPNRKVRR